MDQQLINEIDIMPMKPEDYDDVRALWMTIRGFGIRALDDSREDIERFILGSDGRQGYLYHVCVAKEYRRRGIGTHMVGFCMHQLKAMGINKVALIAFTANDAGNAFWKQIGWNQRADVYYYDFVLNEKNITRFIS